jgi:hypothetical protein
MEVMKINWSHGAQRYGIHWLIQQNGGRLPNISLGSSPKLSIIIKKKILSKKGKQLHQANHGSHGED